MGEKARMEEKREGGPAKVDLFERETSRRVFSLCRSLNSAECCLVLHNRIVNSLAAC